MLDGYHRSFNEHAFRQVDRGVDVPEPSLAIGFAENLAPVPVRYNVGSQRQPVRDKVRTREQATVDGATVPLTMADFPRTGYMGEQLGGF